VVTLVTARRGRTPPARPCAPPPAAVARPVTGRSVTGTPPRARCALGAAEAPGPAS